MREKIRVLADTFGAQYHASLGLKHHLDAIAAGNREDGGRAAREATGDYERLDNDETTAFVTLCIKGRHFHHRIGTYQAQELVGMVPRARA